MGCYLLDSYTLSDLFVSENLPIIMTNAKLASVSDDPLLIMLMSSWNKGYSSNKAQKSQFKSVHGRRGGIVGTAG